MPLADWLITGLEKVILPAKKFILPAQEIIIIIIITVIYIALKLYKYSKALYIQ